jgi:hypothetical protein
VGFSDGRKRTVPNAAPRCPSRTQRADEFRMAFLDGMKVVLEENLRVVPKTCWDLARKYRV